MKKTIYTVAFITLFSVMANAQAPDTKVKKAEPAKAAQPAKAETVNPDGTASPAPAAADNAPQDDKGTKKSEAKPAPGTRMAITEKGVPAKKAAEPKKAEPAKTEKH